MFNFWYTTFNCNPVKELATTTEIRRMRVGRSVPNPKFGDPSFTRWHGKMHVSSELSSVISFALIFKKYSRTMPMNRIDMSFILDPITTRQYRGWKLKRAAGLKGSSRVCNRGYLRNSLPSQPNLALEMMVLIIKSDLGFEIQDASHAWILFLAMPVTGFAWIVLVVLPSAYLLFPLTLPEKRSLGSETHRGVWQR